MSGSAQDCPFNSVKRNIYYPFLLIVRSCISSSFRDGEIILKRIACWDTETGWSERSEDLSVSQCRQQHYNEMIWVMTAENIRMVRPGWSSHVVRPSVVFQLSEILTADSSSVTSAQLRGKAGLGEVRGRGQETIRNLHVAIVGLNPGNVVTGEGGRDGRSHSDVIFLQLTDLLSIKFTTQSQNCLHRNYFHEN